MGSIEANDEVESRELPVRGQIENLGREGPRSQERTSASEPSSSLRWYPTEYSDYSENDELHPIDCVHSYTELRKRPEVVLQIEYVHDTVAKYYVAAARMAFLATIGLLTVSAVWAHGKRQDESDSVTIFNLVVGGLTACSVVVFGSWSIYNNYLMRKGHMKLSKRRMVFFNLCRIDYLALVFVLIFFMIPNIQALLSDCSWIYGSAETLSFIRATFTSILLSNQLLHAFAVSPKETFEILFQSLKLRGFLDKRGIELRRGVELPASVFFCVFLIIWIPVETMLICHFLSKIGPLGGEWCNATDENCIAKIQNCNAWNQQCTLPVDNLDGFTIAVACLFLLHILLYFVVLFVNKKVLRRAPYTPYRITHIELGFQLQTRILLMISMGLGLIFLSLPGGDSCPVQFFTVTGYASTMFAISFVVSLSLWMHSAFIPTPQQVEDMMLNHDLVMLEEEEEILRSDDSSKRDHLCCMETMLKAFYLSHFAYDVDEVKEPCFELNTALSTYELEGHALLWRKEKDAKCFIGWSHKSSTIVLTFRGTSSTKNVLTDLKVWRSTLPSEQGSYFLGTKPMVHAGFLEFWHHTLKDEAMSIINNLMGDKSPNQKWNILLCGHSLGGAAAVLAAYDISKVMSGDDARISCYTFGCPRVGNYAFSNLYIKHVPNTWHVMHFDDIVAQSGKFIFLYKRAGNSCILTRSGAILRPSQMERSTIRGVKLGVQPHFLTAYGSSMLHVLKMKTKSKSYMERKSALRLVNIPLAQKILSIEALQSEKGGPSPKIRFLHGAEFNLATGQRIQSPKD